MKYTLPVSESTNEDAIVIFDWYEGKLLEPGNRFINELEIAKIDVSAESPKGLCGIQRGTVKSISPKAR